MDLFAKFYSIIFETNYTPSVSSELHTKHMDFLEARLESSGLNLFKKDYKFTLRSKFTIFMGFNIVFFNLYTILYYFPDWDNIMKCVPILCLSLQGLAKLDAGIKHDITFFAEKKIFVKNFYDKWSKKPKNNYSLSLCADRSLLFMYLIVVAYISVFIVCYAYPLIWYLVYKEKVYAIVLCLPFIDPYSYWGYISTMIYQSTIIYLGVQSLIGFDGGVAFLIMFVMGLVDTLKNELENLDEELTSNKPSYSKIKQQINNCFIIHSELLW